MSLPKVLMTDVIRSTQQGDSHGGAYLIDLQAGSFEQVLDWNTVEIDWAGRGMGRGLRGICFVGDEIYIAASDELFVFDRSMKMVRSFKNSFLHHCHEISFDGGRFIYLTSTSFDSVLRFDVTTGVFDRAWWFGAGKAGFGVKAYDPMGSDGPAKKDTLHINQVVVHGGEVYVSGVGMPMMWTLDVGRDVIARYAKVPLTTHNCQPIGDQGLVVMNSTGADCVVVSDRRGKVMKRFEYPLYEESLMSHVGIGDDHARQGFGRGLCVDSEWGDRGLIVVGSSPGTVSAFDRKSGEMVGSVNVSMDIRNAPHGLEIWPW
ncbi:MAG: hypothetical protein JKY43_01970 [Phycisphaerales bacterium]|nr:hypothetical protein [Phycisphaerales bacterium]